MSDRNTRRTISTAPTGSCCAWMLDAKHHPNCPRAPQDTLGHALATGVLRGVKGWVWCEPLGVVIPVHHDAYGTTIVHGWRDDPHNHDECDCPGPHTPLYSGPHSTTDQPLHDAEDED